MKRARISKHVMVLLSAVVLCLNLGAAPAPRPSATGPTLKLLKTLPTGSTGRWDYLCPDPDARRSDRVAGVARHVLEPLPDVHARRVDLVLTAQSGLGSPAMKLGGLLIVGSLLVPTIAGAGGLFLPGSGAVSSSRAGAAITSTDDSKRGVCRAVWGGEGRP